MCIKTVCLMAAMVMPLAASAEETGKDAGVQAATAWDGRVKETYNSYLNKGMFFNMRETQASQLPAQAASSLERLLKSAGGKDNCLPKAYSLAVEGKQVFSVQNWCGSRITARIFDGDGRLIAAGAARPGESFTWKDADKSPKTLRAHHHGHGQPDGADGGQDGDYDGGQDHDGGPDGTDQGGGCGDADNGGEDGGFDGSGGLPF